MRCIAVLSTRSFPFPRRPFFLAATFFVAGSLGGIAEEGSVIAGLRQRAEAGDVESMNALGDYYLRGEGVGQNDVIARRFYSQAAELGYAPALFSVGLMAERGRGDPVDVPGAFRSYLKSAERGWVPAQLKIAEMYSTGLGVAQDEAAAVRWFKEAAARVNPEAQFHLALAYEQGRGVTKDREQAQRFYRQSAAQGHVRAAFNLALMLEGGLGAGTDANSAAALYRSAAEQGFAPAQNNYGLLLAEGRGSLPANLVESMAWLTIAVENGANAAGRNLVAQKLNAEQLAAAGERVAAIRDQLAAGRTSITAVVASSPVLPVQVSEPLSSPASTAGPVQPADEPPVASAPEGANVSAVGVSEFIRLESQLAQATKEIAALRLDQERLHASSVQNVAALSDLLASAAEAVRARGVLEAAEQTRRESSRASATGKPPSTAEPEEAKRQLAEAQARVSTSLAKWQVQMTGPVTGGPPVSLGPIPEVSENASGPDPTVTLGAETALNAEIALLSNRVREFAAKNESLGADHEKLKQENTELVTQLASARTAVASAPAADLGALDWAKEKESLQSEVRAAVIKLADVERDLIQARLAGESSRTAASTTAEMQATNAELTSRVQVLSNANDQLRDELLKLKDQTAQLAAQRPHSDESAAEVDQTSVARSEWTKERDALHLQLEQVQSKLTAAEERVIQIKEDNVSAREETAAARRTAAAAQANLARTAELGDRVNEMTSALEEITRLKTAAEENLAGLAPLRSENAQLVDVERRLRIELQERASELAAANERAVQLKDVSDTARTDAIAARATAEEIRARLADAEQQGNRVSQLTSALEELTRENVVLQEKISGTDALRTENARLAGVEQALLAARQRMGELESRTVQLAAVQQEASGLKGEITRLRAEARGLEEQRRNQIVLLQQENAANVSRLRQAQTTLNQIAAAAGVVNGGAPLAAVTPSPGVSRSEPARLVSSRTTRTHAVLAGESLTRLSVRYYGTGSRWPEIYEANRDILRGQTTLRVGQQLSIP